LEIIFRNNSSGFKGGVTISGSRLVLEGTVIGLLIYKSHSDFQLQNAVDALSRRTLASFILRTGVLYFIATFCLEVLAILFDIKTSVTPLWLNGVTNALPLPIPAILISRFLLDLRRLACSGLGTAPTSMQDLSMSLSDINSSNINDFQDASEYFGRIGLIEMGRESGSNHSSRNYTPEQLNPSSSSPREVDRL